MTTEYKSIGSKLRNRAWYIPAILFCVCIIAACVFLISANNTYRLGFPLDDAWIHQTFARNIILYHEWSINPGESTSGSTSPLWTLILAFGNLLNINNLVWSYFLGFICLFLTGYLSEKIVRQNVDSYSSSFPWIGILICSEWHLVWAAFSGMEILLCAVLLLLVLNYLTTEQPKWLLIGIFAGFGIWVRPDAITWIGLIFWWLLFSKTIKRTSIRNAFIFALGYIPLLILYFCFNYFLSNTLFPNTMLAKQMEYLSMTHTSILDNFGKVFFQPMIGVGLFLLPAFVFQAIFDIWHKNWRQLGIFLLILGFIGLYAWKLPVTYQYGRYIMPIIPLLLIYSLIGFLNILKLFKHRSVGFHLFKFAWISSLVLTMIAFMVVGSIKYSQDVAIIESEMVDTANWIKRFISSENIVAAHDIGALGYFGGHKILDLAGLISPDLIPIIRDEERILGHILETKSGYLMIFKKWYPQIDSLDFPVVYQSKMGWVAASDHENMVVYRILP